MINNEYQEICSFCAELEGRDEHNLFYDLLGNNIGYTYILDKTENFVVIPAIGSLVPGYVLVVPREHVLSFGHLSSDFDEELKNLLLKLEIYLTDKYIQKIILFEHGSASFTERGGSCTDHAHLHVVPVPNFIDLLPTMQDNFDVRSIGDISQLHEQIKAGIPYLFLKHHDGNMYICDAHQAKSQHLRRTLVNQLGLGDVWDWLIFPGTDNIMQTIKDYST